MDAVARSVWRCAPCAAASRLRITSRPATRDSATSGTASAPASLVLIETRRGPMAPSPPRSPVPPGLGRSARTRTDPVVSRRVRPPSCRMAAPPGATPYFVPVGTPRGDAPVVLSEFPLTLRGARQDRVALVRELTITFRIDRSDAATATLIATDSTVSGGLVVELGPVQLGVAAAGGQQLGVGAPLDDPAAPRPRGWRRPPGSWTGGGRSRWRCARPARRPARPAPRPRTWSRGGPWPRRG